MPERALREKLFYFALVPAIVLAVLVLGGLSLRTTLQIENSRRQTVFDATFTLADERVDSLDKLIIAQDNVVAAHVDLASLSSISRRWLPTAARETPSVRAILVLDMDHEEHDVLAFASRAPGPEDDTFRRTLVTRLERALPRLGEHRHREMRIGLDRLGGRGQQDGQAVGGHPGTQLDQAVEVPQPQPDGGLR